MVKKNKVAIFRTRCGKCIHLERGKLMGEWKCKPQGNYFHRYEVVDPEFAMLCEKFAFIHRVDLSKTESFQIDLMLREIKNWKMRCLRQSLNLLLDSMLRRERRENAR